MHIEFYSAFTSFLIAVVLGVLLIPALNKLKFGQTVRADGPQRHLSKTGTPTMGGVIFIPAIIISSAYFTNLSKEILIVIFALAGFGLIGFADDFIKITKKRSLGLRANQKLLFQIIISAVLIIYVFVNYESPTRIIMPLNLGYLDLGILYIPITVIFAILGTVNSVNLTDGLDGLVSGVVAIICFFYTIFLKMNGYYNLAITSAAITGACIGFLVFNSYPAKVFMGDTGSLALGGGLAALAVLSRSHFFLALFGLILIIETLSVIIQVISFKMTGKRIFKMSPLHHHFELCGIHESKVVYMFWFITLIAGLFGLLIINK